MSCLDWCRVLEMMLNCKILATVRVNEIRSDSVEANDVSGVLAQSWSGLRSYGDGSFGHSLS